MFEAGTKPLGSDDHVTWVNLEACRILLAKAWIVSNNGNLP